MQGKIAVLAVVALFFGGCDSYQPGCRTGRGTYDVRDYGAVGDGEVLCTQAIQQAVDDCTQAGGGLVRIAGGTYRSGTVELKDNVTLEVCAGATLLGSKDVNDYLKVMTKFVREILML